MRQAARGVVSPLSPAQASRTPQHHVQHPAHIRRGTPVHVRLGTPVHVRLGTPSTAHHPGSSAFHRTSLGRFFTTPPQPLLDSSRTTPAPTPGGKMHGP